MKDAPIFEFMTDSPHTVGAEQTISFALSLMTEGGFRHLPVLHGGALVGVVSDRDLGLIASLGDIDPDTTKVEEAINQVPYRTAPETKLSSVLAEMEAHKYGSALVVDGNKVAGIFTTHDAVSLLARSID